MPEVPDETVKLLIVLSQLGFFGWCFKVWRALRQYKAELKSQILEEAERKADAACKQNAADIKEWVTAEAERRSEQWRREQTLRDKERKAKDDLLVQCTKNVETNLAMVVKMLGQKGR